MIFENLNPWQFLNNLYQRMQIIKDRSLSNDPPLTLWVAQEGITPIREVQMQETSNHIVLKVSIPSLKPENLEIRVTSETVFLSGEKIEQVQVQGYCDFTYSSQQFQCLIPLPHCVHPETVTAELEQNLLLLKLPKERTVSPRFQGIVVRCSSDFQPLSEAWEVNSKNS
ncbi:MAG: Hsp20/alpha crystallin family protein [Planktothrix sp. GU0601_MAG3]|nr:MAG: Hsp20/alpha crystallin family protein [Planktothrix sp. GU0601_MAG3]